MLSLAQQLERGCLVCPVTRRRLERCGSELVTGDGDRRYPIVEEVPILLPGAGPGGASRDVAARADHISTSDRRGGLRRLALRAAELRDDFRTRESLEAFAEVTERMPASALCLSIGGGPGRPHSRLTNLNIERLPEVEVVADAHRLPYADASVDAVHCEAVLEHLARPEVALAEMQRVLATGAKVYMATPFLQGYHAHPGHFQNFTLEGHDAILRRTGFRVLASGTCVGPTFAVVDLVSCYLRIALPGVGRFAWLLTRLLGKLVIPADRRLNRSPRSSELASTVFALAMKE